MEEWGEQQGKGSGAEEEYQKYLYNITT